MNDMAPCPFCGKADVEHTGVIDRLRPRRVYHVTCGFCGALGPETDTREEAIERWNAQIGARSHGDMLDQAMSDGALSKVAEALDVYYHPAGYAVTCDGAVFAYTGSDIMHTLNVADKLQEMYPDHRWHYTESFAEIV